MELEIVLWAVYLFVIGLLFGSFFNVVGYRVPAKQTLLGRSHCPSCQATLGVIELIPIVGYVLLRGKCKHCHTPISIKYPLIEFVTGVLFALTYVIVGDVWSEFLLILLFVSLLIIVTVTDMYYQIVPDGILLLFAPILLGLRLVSPVLEWWDGLLGAALGFLFMYLMAWYGRRRFKKEALGGGDIKLYALIGLVLGYNTVLLSVFFAGVAGILYYLVMRPKGSYLPFVPFIAIGAILSYFIGPTVIDWYLSLFM